MLYGQFIAFLIITAHRSYERIAFDVIIVKHSGDVSGSKLLHPGIDQRKTQNKGSLVAMFHHIYIVRRQFLDFRSDRNNIYSPAFRFRLLLKTQYDIVSKLVRCVKFHIFYQNAEFAFTFVGSFVNIAHFNGGLQDFTTHVFANVCCII